MSAPGTDQLDLATGYRRWHNDLHRPEVLIWSDRQRVLAVLAERRPDGAAVLRVPAAARLDAISGGGRLALIFRADQGGWRRGHVVPLFTNDYVVDRDGGVVVARFAAELTAGRNYALPTPLRGQLRAGVLFQRGREVSLVGLAPYGGEFLVADDPAHCLAPGMLVDLDLWLPWAGPVRLRGQLTAGRPAVGGLDRFTFRTVDRRSVHNAAVVLVGTVDGFDFEALRAAGVRPGRVNRFLTVQTVSDRSTFLRALEVRLVGNRLFGRLTGVIDGEVVADGLDPHSVNFLCLLGDKALGAGRVVVNDGDRARSEIEAETTGLPDWLWEGGFVEVSRLALHPDYRGGGVVTALFREVARLAFTLECRYLLLDAIEKLVPIYTKIGARPLPITKTHPYSKETVRVMVIDISASLGRLDRRWPYWQYLFGPVLRHHVTTSSSAVLTTATPGRRRLPFWAKRALSRVL